MLSLYARSTGRSGTEPNGEAYEQAPHTILRHPWSVMARRIAFLAGVLAVAVAAAAVALYMADGKGPVSARSAAGAAADGPWGPELQLSAASGKIWRWGIASSGRTVHMVWGGDPIHYRRSLDEGATWSADTILSSTGEPRLTDPLVARGSNVYIVYLRNIESAKDWCCPRRIGDIYFRRSRDGGKSWGREIRLTTGRGAHRISLAASDTRLDLVWSDFRTGKWDIYYRRSPDGGGTWDPEVRLVSGDPSAIGAGRPQVASLGDSVHVVWMDGRDRNPRCYTMPVCTEVYYKRSLDGGRTWGGDVRLTFDPPFSGRPDVAALAPSTVIVSYDEDRDDNRGHEQHVMSSNDNGRTWGPTVRLTDAPGTSEHTAILAAGSSVHVAWHDRRPGGGNKNTEIYYRASRDGGASWQPEEPVTISDGKVSTTPLLAATPGYVHLIWLDLRTGSLQVWYRRRKLAADATEPAPESGPDPAAGGQ